MSALSPYWESVLVNIGELAYPPSTIHYGKLGATGLRQCILRNLRRNMRQLRHHIGHRHQALPTTSTLQLSMVTFNMRGYQCTFRRRINRKLRNCLRVLGRRLNSPREIILHGIEGDILI